MSDPHDPRSEDPDRGLDVDAAFADIVSRWEPSEGAADDAGDPGDRLPEPDPAPERDEPTPPARPDPESLRGLFRPAWRDELDDEATWDDEGHFVPPPPPPLPVLDPRRKLAWGGLLGSPVAALLMVAADLRPPGWVALLLVVAFVGGFGYLVATMGSSHPGPGSGSGDGAVI